MVKVTYIYTGAKNMEGEMHGLGELVINSGDFKVVKYSGFFQNGTFNKGIFTRYNKGMLNKYLRQTCSFNEFAKKDHLSFRNSSTRIQPLPEMREELPDIELTSLNFIKSNKDPLYPFLPTGHVRTNLYWVNNGNILDSYRDGDRKLVHRKGAGPGKFKVNLPLIVKDSVTISLNWNLCNPGFDGVQDYTAFENVNIPGHYLFSDDLVSLGLATRELESTDLAIFRLNLSYGNDLKTKTFLEFLEHKKNMFSYRE